MSNVLDRQAPADIQAQLTVEALDKVFYHLTHNMKPKAQQRARAKLEAYATRLETWEGQRLPGPNVSILWDRRTPVERSLSDETERRERALKAEAIRVLIGRAF